VRGQLIPPGSGEARRLLRFERRGRKLERLPGAYRVSASVVRGSDEAASVLSPCFAHLDDSDDREEFWALTLDEGSAPGELLRLAVGADGTMAVMMEDVLSLVLETGRLSFVVAHNHPSNGLEPSVADWISTAVLAKGAARVGLELIDHVIVGGDRYVSMRELGPQVFESRRSR